MERRAHTGTGTGTGFQDLGPHGGFTLQQPEAVPEALLNARALCSWESAAFTPAVVGWDGQ